MRINPDDLAEQILGEIDFLMGWEQAQQISDVALRYVAAKLLEDAQAWSESAERVGSTRRSVADILMATHGRMLAEVFDPDQERTETAPPPEES